MAKMGRKMLKQGKSNKNVTVSKKKKPKLLKHKSLKPKPIPKENTTLDNESDVELDEEVANLKSGLSNLKNTDPEFYNFLQDNDKRLLEFNIEEDDEGNVSSEDDDGIHQPSEELEVASDEEDFVEKGTEQTSGKITLNQLKLWQNSIQLDKSNKTILALMQAFHAALVQINPEADQEVSAYKVEGSAVFNAVIQLCVIHLGPALRQYLGIAEGSKQPPHKCKKFVKVKRALKGYFTDLLKLLEHVSSENIQTALLKHFHYMSPFIISFPNITKSILKRLIIIWGKAKEEVRVVAFFCILRITNNQRAKFLDTVLKSMYITYVKNSKFVSLNTLPALNFMKRSLTEMFALDLNVAYPHVFLYIRQLAIHLRNAISVNKKENLQSVYNWQYVNSLSLWGNLLSTTYNKTQLQQLIYPFVQICLGTIKLVPTSQYYPLRFQIVKILIELSRETGIFIPILPFLLEVLNTYDFNKKHQKVSMKPLNFTCLLRVSKSQMNENGFKDAVMDTVCAQLLEYLADNSHSIGFSDLSLLSTIQIKQIAKQCPNPKYNRKLKQIVEKITQNTEFINGERSKINLNITAFKQIEGFEMQIKNKGTPLAIFYENWKKVNSIKKNKELNNQEEIADYNLPTMQKKKKKKMKGKPDQIEKIEHLYSDIEDSEEELFHKV